MSNYLQLCQRTRKECGIASATAAVPTDTTSQVGILGSLVDDVQRAWIDIQASRPYWKFAHGTLTFTTTAAKRTYDVVTDLLRSDIDKWDTSSAFIYLASAADQTRLSWRDYQWAIRHFDPTYPSNRPAQITEAPGRVLAFDLTPDDVYTINIDFWQTPEKLAADDDIPAIPEHFHDIIVWKAVMMFAGRKGASTLYTNASTHYTRMYNQLVVDQGDVSSERGNFPIAKGR